MTTSEVKVTRNPQTGGLDLHVASYPYDVGVKTVNPEHGHGVVLHTTVFAPTLMHAVDIGDKIATGTPGGHVSIVRPIEE